MTKKQVKKVVIGFDLSNAYVDLAYGFTNENKAIKAIAKVGGYDEEEIVVRKVKVLKFKDKDGEDYYFWGDCCKECGRKNNGITSFIMES